MPNALPHAPPSSLTVPAILLVEHDPNEAAFVHSVMFDVLKADVWLWHEEKLEPALKLLSIVQFRLILLDLDLPGISARKAVRSVRLVAPRTPLMLRVRPEEFRPGLDPRAYQADALVPKGRGEPVVSALRQLLRGR
jgi:Response regulator containing a CheY-like receiver domain and an HTH DNA-binding domain